MELLLKIYVRMRKRMSKQLAVVAMSGGVDSSVAAALLLKKGYEVVGMTMRLWHDPFIAFDNSVELDAAKVCEELDIKHCVVDYQELFRASIVEYFLQEYAAGRTPNPCVLCNKKIKFGVLYAEARKLGADVFATGHYVRLSENAEGVVHIMRAADLAKDQSYVLYHLNQEILKHVVFPLGDLSKSQVRVLAENLKLPVFNKKESQDICFIPDNDHHRFLRTYGKVKDGPGWFVTKDGRIIGRHKGLSHYTVGQRKGLGIAAAEPLYVLSLNVKRNEVVLGFAADAWCQGLEVGDLVLSDGNTLSAALKVQVKIRYNAQPAEAELLPLTNKGEAAVLFAKPLRGIAPGQAAVFYQGDICLGGGTISGSIKQ